METAGRSVGVRGVLVSPTRLEGMETLQKVHDLIAGCQSPTRLEGMETFTSCLTAIALTCLRPALRGWKHRCVLPGKEFRLVSDPP